MAKIAKNVVMYGAKGKLGDQIVIRQRGGEMIIAQAPGKGPPRARRRSKLTGKSSSRRSSTARRRWQTPPLRRNMLPRPERAAAHSM